MVIVVSGDGIEVAESKKLMDENETEWVSKR